MSSEASTVQDLVQVIRHETRRVLGNLRVRPVEINVVDLAPREHEFARIRAEIRVAVENRIDGPPPRELALMLETAFAFVSIDVGHGAYDLRGNKVRP